MPLLLLLLLLLVVLPLVDVCAKMEISKRRTQL
jgi:hypothetical protein